jgi:putative transposase
MNLVVETPRANLVAGMRWFLGTYTARFNRRHRLFGHLFSGRYKSLVVDGSGTGEEKGSTHSLVRFALHTFPLNAQFREVARRGLALPGHPPV